MPADLQIAAALAKQQLLLTRIAQAVERQNELLSAMLSPEQQATLKKKTSVASRVIDATNRPKPVVKKKPSVAKSVMAATNRAQRKG